MASSSPQPVYAGPADNLRRFCRAVIGQIASHVAGGEEEQLAKMALYQEIWYLVAKYEVPIADPSDDVVFVVDKLCRDDDSLDSLNIGENNGQRFLFMSAYIMYFKVTCIMIRNFSLRCTNITREVRQL
jgi:hypothetical protein